MPAYQEVTRIWVPAAEAAVKVAPCTSDEVIPVLVGASFLVNSSDSGNL